ncbi:MAG: hypothetical protein KF796_02095 [Ramlibacter sp.]|nr:hypothetical protein [Ramlibacter sp.]
MQTAPRIPDLPNASAFAMNRWFYKMQKAGLLYHPDEPAENIVNVVTGRPTFTADECRKLDAAVEKMFEMHGDKVYDVCLRYFQKALGIRPQ